MGIGGSGEMANLVGQSVSIVGKSIDPTFLEGWAYAEGSDQAHTARAYEFDFADLSGKATEIESEGTLPATQSAV
jgi:hypothetical protein